MAAEAEIWLLVALCTAVTFVWRGAGLWVSQAIDVDGPVMRLLACIAYATLAALISRILFLPAGVLEATALSERLAAAAVALGLFMLTGRNLFIGIVSGGAALIALVAILGG